VANGVLSLVVILVAVFGYFITFYAGRNVPVVEGLMDQPKALVPYFVGWAAKTAMIWAPMLVLGVSSQPKRWKVVVW